jgi:hypothetical protein
MRLKKDPIGIETLNEYLESASDFSFELRILKMLTQKGISCEHGGQYRDPDTKKFREFDLRLRKTTEHITLVAAVECKAIGPNFPLLISCVHRREHEAFHEVFFHQEKSEVDNANSLLDRMSNIMPKAMEGYRIGASILYPVGGAVGKSTAQVGRRENSGELVSNDAEFFEKWSQALQSLDDLVDEISDDDLPDNVDGNSPHMALALPIVVIPNGTLWTVSYAEDGTSEGPPAQTDRVAIFIGRKYRGAMPGGSYIVSHLEVMTEAGLENFCDTYVIRDRALYNLARGN